MKPLLTLVFSSLILAGFGQSKKTDSLLNALPTASDDSTRIDVLNQLSAEFRQQDFSKALEFALQAKELSETTSNYRGLIKSELNAGMAQYLSGNHAQAVEHYLRSLDLSERRADTLHIILVLNELGTLEKKNNDIAKSEEHLLRALSLSEAISDSSMISHSMNNVGHVYELKGNLVEAMRYYRESAAIREKMGEFYAAAFNYDNIGNILSQQGKYDEARSYFEKEIRIFSELNDRMAHAIAVNNMGEMYNLKGDYGRARGFLFEALEESRVIGFKDLRRHVLSVLSETYRKEGDYRKAYTYLRDGMQLKDSIFNEQQSKQLQDLRTKYETEKKESEIRFLKQENDLKDFRLRQNRLFILGLIVVVLGLILLGFLWQNRTRLKQKAELESTRASLRESQLQAVITSQEEERKRFAADLHDGLGQIISALRLSLSGEKPEKNTVDHALALLNDMNIEIRNIAFNLMPQALMKDGLEQALREFASRMNRSGNIQVSVSAFNLNENMPPSHKVALYRVCQEWVNNVVKYSQGSRISVQLVQHADELVITIEDDGNGFDTTVLMQGNGNGWKNINSRIGLVRGSIEIDSAPGRKGTTLMVTVPHLMMAA